MVEHRELWRISSLLIFVTNREHTLLLWKRIDRINTVYQTKYATTYITETREKKKENGQHINSCHPRMVRYLRCFSKDQDHQWATQWTRRTGTLLQQINIITTVDFTGLWKQGCGWRQEHIHLSTTEKTDCFKILGQWQEETQQGNIIRNRNYEGQLHRSNRSSSGTQ